MSEPTVGVQDLRTASGDFLAGAAGFPNRISQQDARRESKRWRDSLRESTATLAANTADTFSPPLGSIDALVESITFEPPDAG